MPRILELKQILERYGSREIPLYVRHQWAIAYLTSLGRHITRGELRQSVQDARELSRYPRVIFWGLGKLVGRRFVGEAAESRFRRMLLRHRS